MGLLLAVLSCGCASATDRLITEALLTPWHEAAVSSAPSAGTTMGPALARLESRLEAIGITVSYTDLSHAGRDGNTISGITLEGRIRIEETLSVNGRLEVLAHEAGHLFHPPTMTLAERDAFAELVAVEVCARLGWDMAPVSARYLGMFKPGLAGALVSKVDRERAVRVLLGEEAP